MQNKIGKTLTLKEQKGQPVQDEGFDLSKESGGMPKPNGIDPLKSFGDYKFFEIENHLR